MLTHQYAHEEEEEDRGMEPPSSFIGSSSSPVSVYCPPSPPPSSERLEMGRRKLTPLFCKKKKKKKGSMFWHTGDFKRSVQTAPVDLPGFSSWCINSPFPLAFQEGLLLVLKILPPPSSPQKTPVKYFRHFCHFCSVRP